MSVKKVNGKNGSVKVTLKLPQKNAGEAYVVGEFNGWDVNATPMKKGKDGMSVTLELEKGREYQFRYLVDGEWVNDDGADDYVETPYHDARNCVVRA